MTIAPKRPATRATAGDTFMLALAPAVAKVGDAEGVDAGGASGARVVVGTITVVGATDLDLTIVLTSVSTTVE